MKVVLYVARRPKSLNAKLSRGYRDAICAAAVAGRASDGLMTGPLYSRVIWFHRYETTQGDADNILKPIHDALKGLVYEDDRNILRTASLRVNIEGGYAVDGDPDNPEGEYELLRQLDDHQKRDLLYIEIGEQTQTRVRLGPIL